MSSEIVKIKKRFGYPPDLGETPIVNFHSVDMCYADQEPRRARIVDYTQLWQRAICKLYKIQCSICNKYITKKKEKLSRFFYFAKN